MMTEEGHHDVATLTCRDCSRQIDCCEFCDQPDCPVAICFQCIRAALRESLSHPHPHGG